VLYGARRAACCTAAHLLLKAEDCVLLLLLLSPFCLGGIIWNGRGAADCTCHLLAFLCADFLCSWPSTALRLGATTLSALSAGKRRRCWTLFSRVTCLLPLRTMNTTALPSFHCSCIYSYISRRRIWFWPFCLIPVPSAGTILQDMGTLLLSF